MAKKELYYEIIEDAPEKKDGEAELSTSAELAPADGVKEIVAERDYYKELMTAARSCRRVRYTLKPDYRSSYFVVILGCLALELVFSMLLGIVKSRTGEIVMVVIMILAVLAAVVVMILYKVRTRRTLYCYYVLDERGVTCLSYTDDTATLFTGGVAYRLDFKSDGVVTLNQDSYALWLDGEGTGLYAICRAREEDVEAVDGGAFIFVHDGKGGGHEVYLGESGIDRIVSLQPYETDVVDEKTGEAKIKFKTFEKVEPETEFTVEVPQYIKDAFARAGITIPEL